VVGHAGKPAWVAQAIAGEGLFASCYKFNPLMFCIKCGKQQSDDARFCSSCGIESPKAVTSFTTESMTQPKKQSSAWLNTGIIMVIIGFLLAINNFYAPTTAEAVGYDIGNSIVFFLGLSIIYFELRKKKNDVKLESENTHHSGTFTGAKDEATKEINDAELDASSEIIISHVQTNRPAGIEIANNYNIFLPIWGGWGYSKEDAVVIDSRHPIVNPDKPFDGVGIEYAFVKNRINKELDTAQPEGQKFTGIKYKLLEQTFRNDGDKKFDILKFEVEALPVTAKAEPLVWEEEFWFDITSFMLKTR
jgi:hypothetical protein